MLVVLLVNAALFIVETVLVPADYWSGLQCCIPSTVHCTKSKQNFRDITWKVVENMIIHEIFRVFSRFPCYISCYIAENRFPLG